MSSRITMIVIACLIYAISTSSSVARPYDLRGFNLGIPLDQFRGMRHPDGKNSAKIFCEDNTIRSDTRLDRPTIINLDSSYGVILCQFYQPKKIGPVSTWDEAEFRITNFDTEVEFKFIDGDDEAYRLYHISFSFYSNRWDLLKDAYLSKFGKPTRVETAPVQNRMGAVFDNEKLIWENADSIIILEKRSGVVDKGSVIYAEKHLLNRYLGRTAQRKEQDKGNL
jgi:hypothetical protein